MKIFVPAAIAALLAVSTAARADHFAGVYGNTVTQVMANGTRIIIYVNEDKTWERHIGNMTVKGTYAWTDDTHVCFTATDPVPKDPGMAGNCVEVKDDRKAGDTWTDTAPDGSPVAMSITAGR